MNETDLTAAESYFAFGKNWAEFSKKVDEAKIQAAEPRFLRHSGVLGLDVIPRLPELYCEPFNVNLLVPSRAS
jgi:hypothetical protein